MNELPCIKNLSAEELRRDFESRNEPGFRADQVLQWLYPRHAASFDAMTNLSKPLRAMLAQTYCVDAVEAAQEQVSEQDQTAKLLLRLADGNRIETVWIPAADRRTACLSTQVGCKIGCAFCASGARGFTRNLTQGEILDQMVALLRGGRDVTHVVFMGIGEPFDNFEAVVAAIRILNSPKAFNIGARRITVSTAGIPEKILEFGQLDWQVELAVSLHAPDDELRTRLVPLNRKHPIGKVLDACRRYVQETNRQITFEYVLLDGVNDSDMHARRLGEMLRGMLAKVNLISFNAHAGSDLRPSRRLRAFQSSLETAQIPVTVRQSRGLDILAACGQLRHAHAEG